MGCNRIGPVQVNGPAIYHDILYPVWSVHAYEIPLIIQLHTGLNRSVNGIGKPGHLKESAAFLRIIPGPHFQRVLNLLACGLDDTAHVAEREYCQGIIVSDAARLYVGPDASAVTQADIGSKLYPVSVSCQISQVGLPASHPAFSVSRVIDRQKVRGGAENHLKCLIVLILDALDEPVRIVIHCPAVLIYQAVSRNHKAHAWLQHIGILYLIQVVVVDINPSVIGTQLPLGNPAEAVIFLYHIFPCGTHGRYL